MTPQEYAQLRERQENQTLRPEDACKLLAWRLAEYHFPKSRVHRSALYNDVFLLLRTSVDVAFKAGLQRSDEMLGANIAPEVEVEDIAV